MRKARFVKMRSGEGQPREYGESGELAREKGISVARQPVGIRSKRRRNAVQSGANELLRRLTAMARVVRRAS